jgi:ankyrin repeat protein
VFIVVVKINFQRLKSIFLVQNNYTGLHYAAANGKEDTAVMLLGKGALIEARNKVSNFID